MQATREQVLKSLEEVRTKHGEEAYATARKNLAVMLVGTPEGVQFVQDEFPELDLAAIKEAARLRSAESPESMMAFLRTHVPSLKTEVQFNLFMAAFNALTLSLDSYFSGKPEEGDKAVVVLKQTLEAAKKERAVAAQVEEIPVEERSREAASFTNPPKVFIEVEEQKQLLAELAAFKTAQELGEWYKTQRTRIDNVVTQKYRDELFDAIRAKQHALSN